MNVFKKLSYISPNNYSVNQKKMFLPLVSLNSFVNKTFEFAFDMTFGEKGHHRSHRSGGTKRRALAELLANTLQGKLAEFAFFGYANTQGIAMSPPDLNTFGKGFWDNGDFQLKDTKISVKSGAHFANLMLFETKDWDAKGHYLPDGSLYNAFVFCRVKPNVKELVENRIDSSKEKIWQNIQTQNWQADIPGFITRKDFCHLMDNRFILPKQAMLNNTIMDAENLYVQCGNLRPITSLTDFLKTLR